jgi:BsuBI/PstI restriction endonuclease domain/BsuBI/PstI restriction endonuclease HTH domain
MTKEKKLLEAHSVLIDLGLPRQQLNDRTALCLLAILNLKPATVWADCTAPLLGITPIMNWARDNFNTDYAPNTRETFRRQSMHQFIEAGICTYNPDKPSRPVNSPKVVYQIEPTLLSVLQTFGTSVYAAQLKRYLSTRKTLIETYARAREMEMIPVKLSNDKTIALSAGEHSELIKAIVEEFGSRYAAGGELVYVGDTGDKHGFLDEELLAKLGVVLNKHSKMPDVVVYIAAKNWLLLIESVTSHGPVDSKRQGELAKLFAKSSAGLVYVSAFLTRKTFLKYLRAIAWESEVWIADEPSHMIHFNGVRFLGPYE